MPLPTEAEEVWRYSPHRGWTRKAFRPANTDTGQAAARTAAFSPMPGRGEPTLAHAGALVEVRTRPLVSVTREGSPPERPST